MTTAYSGDGITFPDSTVQATAPKVGMVNRLINSDMRIDQRNSGAAVTATLGAYGVDRWLPQENNGSTVTAQQSTTSPAGFTNSLLLTASTGATSTSVQVTRVQQRIEGLNTSDLAWGTANAQTVTVSFWVRSSVTGTYCFGFMNSAQDRAYAAEYSISVADTWEYKTITIAGDTSGTWLTTNGIGINCLWDLGSGSDYNQTGGSWSGTNDWKTSNQVNWVGNTGATFYLTGVQLEKGSTATDFEYVDYGRQLQMCQRYYEKSYDQSVAPGSNTSVGVMSVYSSIGSSTNRFFGHPNYLVPKRASIVSITFYTATGTAGSISKYSSSATTLAVSSIGSGYGENKIGTYIQTTGGDASEPYVFHYTASAEL